MILLAAILAAIANRLRGGAVKVPGGTQVGRAIWAAFVCGVMLAGGLKWWALAGGVAAFAGATVGQFGGLDMGRRSAPKVSPWITMAGWGVARVIGPCLVLTLVLALAGDPFGAYVRPVPFYLSGLACPLVYWAVWLIPPRWFVVKGLGRGDVYPDGYDPPQLAEALHGALMGAALWLSVAGW